MTNEQLVQFIVGGLGSVVVSLSLYQLKTMTRRLESIDDKMDGLAIFRAAVEERCNYHEQQMLYLRGRLDELEKN